LINYEILKETINPENYDGLVVECYASGTFPINNPKFIDLF